MSRPLYAIVLAAGRSSRMGRPKGLLDVDDAPMIVRHVEAFSAAGLVPVVVVGAAEADYRAVLTGLDVVIVVNAAWATTGPAESLRLALAATGAADVLVAPVDVPPAAPATIAALIAAAAEAVPTFGGVDGHPVRLVGALAVGERLDVRLRGACRVPVTDPDAVLNLNTPAEWAAWRHRPPLS